MAPSTYDKFYSGVQALEFGQCVLAALWHERSLSLAELVARLDGVGRKVNVSALSLALLDLQDKLAADAWFPFVLIETGTKWALCAKHAALENLAGDGKLHPVHPLSMEELEVLSVIVFNGPEGISHTAIQRCVGVDPSAALDRLSDEQLIYVIPGKAFEYWRPSPEILSRFRLRRFSDLPGYRDFRAYLHGEGSLADAEKTSTKEIRRASKRHFS